MQLTLLYPRSSQKSQRPRAEHKEHVVIARLERRVYCSFMCERDGDVRIPRVQTYTAVEIIFFSTHAAIATGRYTAVLRQRSIALSCTTSPGSTRRAAVFSRAKGGLVQGWWIA